MLLRILKDFVKILVPLGIALSSSRAAAQFFEEEPIEDQSLEEQMIRRNIQLSEWFDGVAERIDLFFVGKRVTRDRNKTRVTIENTSYSMEHKSIRNATSIGVYPQFPNLEKYWALKFTSYDEKEARQVVQPNYIRGAARRQNYGATVAWFRKFGAIRTSFEPRIELQDPLRISHSLTFESIANYSKSDIRPKLELYASARRGPGFLEAIDLNFFLSKFWTLTLVNQGDYLDKTRTYSTNNGFIFGHNLSKKTTMSYSFMLNSNNRPNYHLDGYVTSVSFNEMVYKKIFDYTITPYLEFLRANSFKGQAGAVLNLRLTF